jgi:hypothetical protein
MAPSRIERLFFEVRVRHDSFALELCERQMGRDWAYLP